ncbi:type II secretion system protein [Pendulispora albinea]|uniref:Type II secretion system GspH family protein n=1 Tax=Pendulispora albinea TaxID=2741071 RepID=A0ABZ2M990_9BACT
MATKRGFTLIEVVNALALTSIIVAIAMYFVARYLRHAKTAEAVGSLNAMAAAAANYYDTSDANQPAGTQPESAKAMRHFPPSSRASVPPNLTDVRGRRYQSALADWSASPWAELHFSLPQAQFYAYSFESQGSGPQAKATAIAQGDLDGDGIMSRYSITVAPDETLHAKVSPVMERQNPEE